MKFDEKPDIAYLRKLFKDLFFRTGYDYDFVFDWMVKKPTQVTSGAQQALNTSAEKAIVDQASHQMGATAQGTITTGQ